MQSENKKTKSKNAPSRIGITCGDPAGIGFEVVLKAIADREPNRSFLPVIIADADFLQKTADFLHLPCNYKIITKETEISRNKGEPLIFHVPNIKENIEFGTESAIGGKASAEYIEIAVKLIQTGFLDAVATAPISKKAIQLGGYDFPGHTEFLAFLTNTKEFAMSFMAENLCVVLLSTHLSLKNAIAAVKRERIVKLIRLVNRQLKEWGVEKPRLAVAGLNPHAGESGLFGDEEILEINPAIRECRAEGIEVSGAYSADTLFLRNRDGEFDAVIANYHDQATIPVKSLSFGESVNVTMGLPFVRTSVDHGTGFDIAGKNTAKHSSMKAAIKMAADLHQNRLRK